MLNLSNARTISQFAASEGSSSQNLGEYAVSARSDLRSTANATIGSAMLKQTALLRRTVCRSP